ncbi:MAG: hypothetical protein JWL66_892 [Sphingomonadales bacterium]|nr:hypothetical protein [Sphingomonadales bacterium]
MVMLSRMTAPTRADLETAAQLFFEKLAAEINQPRGFDFDHIDEEIALNLEETDHRVRDLDRQLAAQQFYGTVDKRAQDLVSEVGGSWDDLPANERLFALQLSARVEREQLEVFRHSLKHPASRYQPVDPFLRLASYEQSSGHAQLARMPDTRGEGTTLGEAVRAYLIKKEAKNLSQSNVDEVNRALGWLMQRLSATLPIQEVSREQMRKFRSDVERMDVTKRGQRALFDDRLTDTAAHQIASVTAQKYWKSVQSFFAWAKAELSIDDPAAGLVIETRKGQTKKTPEPFTQSELLKLLQTPLYAGYKTRKTVTLSGECHVRDGRWWAGMVLMFTGMRAGELAQLLFKDFDFAAPIPHIKIRNEDEAGNVVKSTKNAASVRNMPIAAELLQLGLAEFVSSRGKSAPNARVFREFHIGAGGRTADGMSKFWGPYLRKFDLWKTGRATHVWRHTLIATLRANGVVQEDIAALVGHSQGTVTGGYGGDYPLERKYESLKKLDFGFDVVAAAGGPYIKAKHS